jgi:hypothetical protein
MEPPIRIKLYGLATVTKRGYLVQLAVVVVLLVVLLGIWAKLPSPNSDLRNLPPEYVRLVTLLSYLPWVVLAIAVLVGLEAFFVLRRFAREEAQRRAGTAQQPQPPPAT